MTEIKFGLEGVADVFVGKADKDGNLIPKTLEHRAYARNVITSTGLDDLGAGRGSGWGYFVAVGSGTGTPAQADLSLFNYVATSVAGTSVAGVISGGSPWYMEDRRRFEFGAGAAAGNLTELGLVAVGGSADKIQSHALFTDISGSPTTVVVLADDILVIHYYVRVYVLETDTTYNTTVNGVTTAFNMRSQLTEAFTLFTSSGSAFQMYSSFVYSGGQLNGIGVQPSGTLLNEFEPVYGVPTDYTPGSYYRETAYSYPLSRANGVWTSVLIRTQGGYRAKFGISPAFTKTASNTVNWTVRVAWANYVPA